MNPSAAFFCICMIAVYSAGEKPSKSKREVSGLYPFPRVGKGDVSWSPQIIGPREMKRQGLIPFPRVGRNRDNEELGKKRDVTENGGGMWFGPRLGRLQKKDYLDEDATWALIQTAALGRRFLKFHVTKFSLKGIQAYIEFMNDRKEFRSEKQLTTTNSYELYTLLLLTSNINSTKWCR